MSLFSRFFYRRPPDGLLEFVERVYVFDSCFSTEVLSDGMYQIYLREVITQLHEEFADSSFLAFNFREGGGKRSQFAEVLCDYDVTVIDYPRQYEGCPLLPLSLIHHFLRVSESWLSLGTQQNIVLLHCERGGWPLLAFLLASFLVFRKLHYGEQRTLEMVFREAPKGFLQLLSPLNPFPSQLRYLQYIGRRSIAPEWPPMERSLSVDCLILRSIPRFDYENGCRPLVRIFGQNLHSKGGLSTDMLFSMSKKKKSLRHYRQEDCDVIKIDIQCLVQGDVVLECLHFDVDSQRETMMFRIMFNTAFIRSNILILTSDNIDILWGAEDRYPKGFRAEVLFGDVESISPARIPTTTLNGEVKGGLPIEAFSKVHELFSGVEWVESGDDAAFWLLKHISPKALQEKFEKIVLSDAKELSKLQSKVNEECPIVSPVDSDQEKEDSVTSSSIASVDSEKNSPDFGLPSSLSQSSALNSSADSDVLQNAASLLTQPPLPSVEPLLALSNEHSSKTPEPPTSTALHSLPNKAPPAPPPPPPPFRKVSQKDHVSTAVPYPPIVADQETLLNTSVEFSRNAAPALPPPPPPLPPPPVSKRDVSLPHPRPPNPSLSHKSAPPRPPPPPPTSVSGKGLPPPPPPPPPMFGKGAPPPPPTPAPPSISVKGAPPPPPPPPPPTIASGKCVPPPPPPPPPVSTKGVPLPPQPSSKGAPPPPPPPPVSRNMGGPPPPPPPPIATGKGAPPPPPPPSARSWKGAPPPPPPPTRLSMAPPPPPGGKFLGNGAVQPPSTVGGFSIPGPPQPPGDKVPNTPTPQPPSVGRGRGTKLPSGRGHGSASSALAPKRSTLKPLHWVKVTRAMQGSLWADSQKQENLSKAPEIDMSELESLFSTAVASDATSVDKGAHRRGASASKPEIVHLVDMRRANNCEIMLTKIKIPLPDMITAILALDDSALDIDQVENLIKFCPTKEEMEMLKNYTGARDTLGRCEQFFLELMKVPRVESKLRVFAFRITFAAQIKELRTNLNTINDASREVRESVKLRQIMQTILTLGNALNQGTARGSAVGFRLDSLLKLSDTRARNNKMTLMHYLCKLLAEKMPELLDFDKDLIHLEAASKIQLKLVAEEMQAVSKGLEKVEQELTASDSDGAVSMGFRKALKSFLDTAEADVRSVISLYSEVGRNADSLAQYFGEDPARCPFEQVTSILVIFVNTFKKSREENERQAEVEKKKSEKEAMKEKTKTSSKKDEVDFDKTKFISPS